MTSRIESVWADFNARRVQSVTRELSRIPDDIEALDVQTKTYVDWNGLAGRRNLRRLCIGPLKPDLLPHLERLGQVEALFLWDVRADSLSNLAPLQRLRDLVIRSAPKLSDLAGVSSLRGLRSLWLWDVPRLAALDDIARLGELRELIIETAPSRDARGAQRIPSLAPLSHLSRLERLRLIGVATVDGSLAPLHGLRHLRHIHLPNTFALAEFAALAGALPTAKGNFAEPVWTVRVGTCRKCSTEKVMLLGRGTRMACPTCEAERIAGHVAEFERVRAASHINGDGSGAS